MSALNYNVLYGTIHNTMKKCFSTIHFFQALHVGSFPRVFETDCFLRNKKIHTKKHWLVYIFGASKLAALLPGRIIWKPENGDSGQAKPSLSYHQAKVVALSRAKIGYPDLGPLKGQAPIQSISCPTIVVGNRNTIN